MKRAVDFFFTECVQARLDSPLSEILLIWILAVDMDLG